MGSREIGSLVFPLFLIQGATGFGQYYLPGFSIQLPENFRQLGFFFL
jgi:hypothetical protein